MIAPKKIIRLSKSCIGQEEIERVTAVLKAEYLGMGTEVKEFERILTDFFGRPAVCVNTGTAALQLALQAMGIKSGDEVLVPTLTYVASFQAIAATGATAVPCDVRADNICIDISDAERKLTAQTRAIMPVFYTGNASLAGEIYAFAEKHSIRVIEDAAHAFGSYYKGMKVGSFGDVSCFSLDGIKNITSGEGGIIVSDDKSIIDGAKDLRLLGVEKDTEKRYSGQRSWEFDVTEQGWRFHMSNIMAAIGIAQFKKLEIFREKRQQLARLYVERLAGLPFLQLLQMDYTEVNPHVFVVRVIGNHRDKLKSFLEERGIQTGLHYKPNHLLTKFRSFAAFPVANQFYLEMLSLPLHADISFDDFEYLINCIKSFQPDGSN